MSSEYIFKDEIDGVIIKSTLFTYVDGVMAKYTIINDFGEYIEVVRVQ